MFENLNVWEVGALLLLALLIFGDRLPKVIGDGLKMLRRLRQMAQNATGDLSRELGTDLQLEDLHPKTFLRKHLLSEEEEEALRRPLRGVYDTVRADLDGVRSELNGVADTVNRRPRGSSLPGPDRPASGAAASRGYDDDTT